MLLKKYCTFIFHPLVYKKSRRGGFCLLDISGFPSEIIVAVLEF